MNITGKSLLVFGSRTLDDERIEAEVAKFIDGTDYRLIVTALDPGGVCDHMLAIWDGSSKGTAGEIKLAKKMGVPTTIIRLEPRPKPNLAALDFDMQDMSALLDDLTANGQMGADNEELRQVRAPGGA